MLLTPAPDEKFDPKAPASDRSGFSRSSWRGPGRGSGGSASSRSRTRRCSQRARRRAAGAPEPPGRRMLFVSTFVVRLSNVRPWESSQVLDRLCFGRLYAMMRIWVCDFYFHSPNLRLGTCPWRCLDVCQPAQQLQVQSNRPET